MPASVEFDTTVTATGNNSGIVVPEDAIARLDAGRRPAVIVNVNGYEYRNTVGVMAGRHMLSISAAVRKETGLKGGDPVHVTRQRGGAASRRPSSCSRTANSDSESGDAGDDPGKGPGRPRCSAASDSRDRADTSTPAPAISVNRRA